MKEHHFLSVTPRACADAAPGMNTTTEGDTMPMDTLALLDPALREVVISLPELAALPAGGLQQARDAAAALVAGEGPPAADGVHIEDLQVPGPYKGGPV